MDAFFYDYPVILGAAKEPGMMYFPTKRRVKEPQNPQNHMGDGICVSFLLVIFVKPFYHRKEHVP